MLQTAASSDLKVDTKSNSDSKSSHKPLEVMQHYLLDAKERPCHLALIPDNRLVIVNADLSLCVRDLKTNKDTQYAVLKDKKADAKTITSGIKATVIGEHLIVSSGSGRMHAWHIYDAKLVPVKTNPLRPMTAAQITAVDDSHVLVIDGTAMPSTAEFDTRRRLYALSDILEQKHAEAIRIVPYLLPAPATKTQPGATCTATAALPAPFTFGIRNKLNNKIMIIQLRNFS